MRWLIWFAISAALLSGQETSTYIKSTTDLNGNRIEATRTTESRSKTGSDRTEKFQSINGRLVPAERIEEHVIRDDSSGKVIEQTILQFDQTGNPGPPVKVRIEEQKRPDGVTIRSTTFRGDLNGNLVPAERSITETTMAGTTTRSETVIERPSLGGSFEPAEKRSFVREGTDKENQQTEVVSRKGASGFYTAVRVITRHSEKSGASTDTSAEYEVGSSGALELHSQTVVRAVKGVDGSETVEADHFGNTVGGMRLQVQEVSERRTGAGGIVVERISARRPSVSDPSVLGPSTFISETVCKGKCH